ncbi:MAG: glutamate-5-semialdehyde dehydrogenase [Dehalococcoidia bacterium]|nr:glutamate-5-semialdehyde dehydrogenase [Dehalococcoidia bacterium]
MTAADRLRQQGSAAQAASATLARLPTETRNHALTSIARALETEQGAILDANAADYRDAKADGIDDAFLDRLLLTPERLNGMASDVRSVAGLPDPVGELVEDFVLENGLDVEKRRVPLGVIASIYESRPNVTTDIVSLALKSGNACILRGGKETLRSNSALVALIHRAIAEAGLPTDAVQFVDNTDRSLVDVMLSMKEHINLLVPRGGAGLINFVAKNATMPVLTGGVGVCHTYVDRDAESGMAANIVYNAKVQRPTVCNALDTVLVHSEAAARCLPEIASRLNLAGVEMRCDHRALSILGPGDDLNAVPAQEEDWGKEFLALIASVKVVDSLDDALDHIQTYGSGHSEAIVTEDNEAAERFLNEVDAAAVYHNTSTRFTDGAQFGLGAEVGISTQKFHARGPLGLRELTSYKWVVRGSGQIRQ